MIILKFEKVSSVLLKLSFKIPWELKHNQTSRLKVIEWSTGLSLIIKTKIWLIVTLFQIVILICTFRIIDILWYMAQRIGLFDRIQKPFKTSFIPRRSKSPSSKEENNRKPTFYMHEQLCSHTCRPRVFRGTRFKAASVVLSLPFGFEDAFKGEEAFKEERCIQGGKIFKKRTHRQTYYVLYNIDS